MVQRNEKFRTACLTNQITQFNLSCRRADQKKMLIVSSLYEPMRNENLYHSVGPLQTAFVSNWNRLEKAFRSLSISVY